MKNKIAFAAVTLLSLALAAYCGYRFCTQIFFDMHIALVALVYVAFLIASWLLCDLLHETAHLAVGSALKMGVKISELHIFGSSSVSINPRHGKHIKGRMAVTCLAGLFINLLTAVAGLLALFLDGYPVWLCALLPPSFYFFALNSLLCEFAGGKTDGLVVWEILTNAPSAQVLTAILTVQGLVNSGRLLKDIDKRLLFDLPQLPEDDINFVILTHLRYEYCFATGDKEGADKYLDRYNGLTQRQSDGNTEE